MNNTQFDIVQETMKRLEKKIDMLLYEEDIVPEQKQNTTFVEDDVFTKGERVPYSKLSGEQVLKFKDFLEHVRMNERDYSQREIDYCSFSDKSFKDIRLSDNALRILAGAYQRTYGKPWSFHWVKGYLYKYEGQKGWKWSDGSFE